MTSVEGCIRTHHRGLPAESTTYRRARPYKNKDFPRGYVIPCSEQPVQMKLGQADVCLSGFRKGFKGSQLDYVVSLPNLFKLYWDYTENVELISTPERGMKWN